MLIARNAGRTEILKQRFCILRDLAEVLPKDPDARRCVSDCPRCAPVLISLTQQPLHSNESKEDSEKLFGVFCRDIFCRGLLLVTTFRLSLLCLFSSFFLLFLSRSWKAESVQIQRILGFQILHECQVEEERAFHDQAHDFVETFVRHSAQWTMDRAKAGSFLGMIGDQHPFFGCSLDPVLFETSLGIFFETIYYRM